MTVFDYINFTCPKCRKLSQDVSKVGTYYLNTYNLDMTLSL